MVIEEAVGNITDFFSALPPQLVDNVSSLVTILKVTGIAFIIYIAYMIFSGIMNYKKTRRIKKIEKKVNSIDKKLDKLLKKKK